MPIFEFRCLECGHVFEKLFMSSDDEVILECPECHAGSLSWEPDLEAKTQK